MCIITGQVPSISWHFSFGSKIGKNRSVLWPGRLSVMVVLGETQGTESVKKCRAFKCTRGAAVLCLICRSYCIYLYSFHKIKEVESGAYQEEWPMLHFVFFGFGFLVLGIKARASHMLSTYFPMELHTSPCTLSFELILEPKTYQRLKILHFVRINSRDKNSSEFQGEKSIKTNRRIQETALTWNILGLTHW